MIKQSLSLNRVLVIFIVLLACVMLLIVQGCGVKPSASTDANTTDSGGTAPQPIKQVGASVSPNVGITEASAADVRWVYMSWPIPSSVVSRPLIGSRDQDRITGLLHWLEEAKRIDGTGLASPLHGRSMAVNIELNDGRLLQIRPAWKCNSRKDEQGNTETSCKTVENHIWVSEPVDGEYFAESERLYRFVSKGYMDWMPNVKPYEAPDQLKTGATFLVRGHGSRTDQANVALMKGNDTIWKQRASVNEGEWQAEGVISDNLPEGDYEWKINTGTTTYGVTVHISKR